MRYGRSEDEWDELAEAGLEFLVERARHGMLTSYTELNDALADRTGLARFDFSRPDERAAMGHLLGLVVERDYPTTGLMISALVHYLGGNDAGPGFYALAVELGLLPKDATRTAKDEFWVSQVAGVHRQYAASS